MFIYIIYLYISIKDILNKDIIVIKCVIHMILLCVRNKIEVLKNIIQ